MEVTVRVLSYAGMRGEERPRVFFRGEERVEIREILRSWIQEEKAGGNRRRLFRVRTDEGEYLLSHDEGSGRWSLSPGVPQSS